MEVLYVNTQNHMNNIVNAISWENRSNLIVDLLKNGYDETVAELIVDYDINVMSEKDKEWLPRIAAETGALKTMKKLKKIGIDIHCDNEHPLIVASSFERINLIKYFIDELSVDIHVEEDTLLRTACSLGNIEIAEYLLSKGADIHARKGMPLANACLKNNLEMVKFLISKGADYTENNSYSLVIVIQRGYKEIEDFFMSLKKKK